MLSWEIQFISFEPTSLSVKEKWARKVWLRPGVQNNFAAIAGNL
jgi:hypothetical protein